MIIWSRWGIIVLAFVGLGVLLGFTLGGILGLIERSGPVNGVWVGLGLVISAVGLWFFVKYMVGTRIDQPRPAVMYEQLPEPVKLENGTTQTHRVIPIVHPETGQQIYTNPVSTFFFIPLKYWPYILGGIGVLVFLINLVGLLTRR